MRCWTKSDFAVTYHFGHISPFLGCFSSKMCAFLRGIMWETGSKRSKLVQLHCSKACNYNCRSGPKLSSLVWFLVFFRSYRLDFRHYFQWTICEKHSTLVEIWAYAHTFISTMKSTCKSVKRQRLNLTTMWYHIPCWRKKQRRKDGDQVSTYRYAKLCANTSQSLRLHNKAIFHNKLVAMRPTTKKEIPSAHEVSMYIHNKFVEWLKDMKNDILIRSFLVLWHLMTLTHFFFTVGTR